MINFKSIRQYLLGIENRAYKVSSSSYPARLTFVRGCFRFTFKGHTLAEIEQLKVKAWTAKELSAEFDLVLSSKFGLEDLAWDLLDIDTFLNEAPKEPAKLP